MEQTTAQQESGNVRRKDFELYHDGVLGRCPEQEARTDIASETVYDSLGRGITKIVAVKDAVVSTSENIYDNTGKLLALMTGEKREDKKGMRYRCITHWYDASGRQIAQADHGCSDQPIALSKRVLETSAKVWLMKSEFDRKTGKVAKSVDATGCEQSIQFDANGRAIKSFRKRGGKQELLNETIYNAAGLMTVQVDAFGHRMESKYDAQGRKIAQIDTLGNMTQFIYIP